MSDHKYNQNILIGAAVAAGILGTLTGLLGSKKPSRGLAGQAKNIANHVLESGDMVNKKMVLGGVAGGLVGAAAALLLAPKSGAELLKDIARPFSHDGTHARSTSHKKSASRSSKKGGSSRKAAAKSSEKKAHHASTTKKSPAKRRTAVVASKATSAAEEKSTAGETKGS